VTWQDKLPAEEYVVPDTVVDAVFAISCRNLPVDHAYALSRAIQIALPWFADEEAAGLHIIHGAESGNGWVRPAEPQALLHLSRRTKLALRLPKRRFEDARALVNQTLMVDGQTLRVDSLGLRPLAKITTLFSRHVVITPDVGAAEALSETDFLQAAAKQLNQLGIKPRKMMCGLTTTIATPARKLQTCSLMLAELSFDESVRLQQHGLGPERKLGCGIFLPHKDIGDLRHSFE